MSRYRLYPTPEQEKVLLEHCAHARFVWNLAVEQRSWWHPGRKSAPGLNEQSRQLTEARAAFPWLAAGSQMVQQQALRDFAQALNRLFAGLNRPPKWRKEGKRDGFQIVAAHRKQPRSVNRRWSEVWVPKVGWVRFRRSRAVPDAKSYRVTRDRAGRWHVAFAVKPDPIPAPGNGEIVGVDRGVTVSAALSTGELLTAPRLRPGEEERLLRLQRKLARAKPGSNRRKRVKTALAKMHARDASRRKDWVEKISTDLARRFDLIRIEDLHVQAMTRSAKGTLEKPGRSVRQRAGLNRRIRASGWGLLARRLIDKAPGRVEKINPAFTSQTCSVCGTTDREARESQAVFRCRSCGHTDHADINAARNIAAGHAVTARGDLTLVGSANREPEGCQHSVFGARQHHGFSAFQAST